MIVPKSAQNKKNNLLIVFLFIAYILLILTLQRVQ